MSLHASASPSRPTQIKRVINKEQMRVPEKDVPRTLSDAVIVFVRHPTVIGVLIGLSGMAAYRLSLPWTFQDPIGEQISKRKEAQDLCVSCIEYGVFVDFPRVVSAQVCTALQSRLVR